MPIDAIPPPASPASPIRRIRVHRRRTPLRIFSRFLNRLLFLLFLVGLATDFLYPRTLSPPNSSILPPFTPPPLISLTPFLILRTPLQWTPVQTLSLLHLPAISPHSPTLIHASPVVRTLFPNTGIVFITLISHGAPIKQTHNLSAHASIRIPRFTAFSLHTDAHAHVTLFEYTNGLSLAAALHSSLVAALAVGNPLLPFEALVSEMQNLAAFLQIEPWRGAAFAGRLWRMEALRRFADRKREKRSKGRAKLLEEDDVL